MNHQPLVAVLMGSKSDWPIMKTATELLGQFDVAFEKKVISAHRTPNLLYNYMKHCHERGIEVIISGAGGAAHAPGMAAALTHLPVIGVPILGKAMNGLDSLLSIVQMPGGIPVATVGVDNAKNAALLACRILGIKYPEISKQLREYAVKLAAEVEKVVLE